MMNERDIVCVVMTLDTDPCKFNSSANVPAKSSNCSCCCWLNCSALPLAVSVSAMKSVLYQSDSMPMIEGIGLSLPTELALELARCRKSGDNWKFPLRIHSQSVNVKIETDGRPRERMNAHTHRHTQEIAVVRNKQVFRWMARK